MARPSAGDRLRRLLAIVPWVVAADGPTVEEVCRRFNVAEDDLLADLEMVFCCGVHPFTPDSLMDVVIDEGRVWIRYAEYFDRPFRLSPDEGLALVAAGAAILAVPGADPEGALARGLRKVAGVLGVELGEDLDVRLGAVPEGVLASLRDAVEQARQVEIDYYVYGRDERTRRVVEPHSVFTAEGEWYLTGFCHLAGAERRFRVDRIAELAVLDKTFVPPRKPSAPQVFDPRPDDPRVVLDLAPRARWVAEQYPIEHAEERSGGRLRVTLVAGERAWLDRLLLRLGPHARVVDGAPAAAAEAATRVLARYSAR
ncbi:MAG: WYL domain-containing protein [Acidobacteria bacterium]|nr:WYL domain-containing protein [Acidobacteriota bacterium]